MDSRKACSNKRKRPRKLPTAPVQAPAGTHLTPQIWRPHVLRYVHIRHPRTPHTIGSYSCTYTVPIALFNCTGVRSLLTPASHQLRAQRARNTRRTYVGCVRSDAARVSSHMHAATPRRLGIRSYMHAARAACLRRCAAHWLRQLHRQLHPYPDRQLHPYSSQPRLPK